MCCAFCFVLCGVVLRVAVLCCVPVFAVRCWRATLCCGSSLAVPFVLGLAAWCCVVPCCAVLCLAAGCVCVCVPAFAGGCRRICAYNTICERSLLARASAGGDPDEGLRLSMCNRLGLNLIGLASVSACDNFRIYTSLDGKGVRQTNTCARADRRQLLRMFSLMWSTCYCFVPYSYRCYSCIAS